jgi:hypothetical protein
MSVCVCVLSVLVLSVLIGSKTALGGGIETAHSELVVTHAIHELEVREMRHHMSTSGLIAS